MAALGGINVDEVRIAQTGRVYTAAVGAAAPTNSTTALTTAWTDLGYVTEEGVTTTPSVTFGKVKAWQSAIALKRPLDEVEFEIMFKIMQTNKAVTSLFWLGATWTNGPLGVATLVIPSNPTYSNLESALVVDWTDDSAAAAVTRMYYPRGIVSKREPLKSDRKDILEYGLTYLVNDSNGSIGTIFSNSTALYSS